MNTRAILAVLFVGTAVFNFLPLHAARIVERSAAFDVQPKLMGASCTLDTDCSAGTYCDEVQAVCLDQVEDQQNCLRDAQCKSGSCKVISFMGPAIKMCIQDCSTAADCPADAPKCVKHAHLVLPAADGSDDPTPAPGPAPVPAPKKTGMCVQCKHDVDCGATQYCLLGWSREAFTCAELGPACVTKKDCNMGEFCDKTRKQCRRWMSTDDFVALLA